jgi:leucyl-tRNA synthetase
MHRGCPAADTPRVREYVRKVFQMDDVARKAMDQPKTGEHLDVYARNPFTGARVPVFVADYVLPEYGTGAVMVCG